MTELPYELDRVEVPTLLVSAEDDLFNTLPNARAAAAAIPRSQLIEYKTGGHLLLDRDAHLWPAIVSFMERSSTTYCNVTATCELIADQSN
jgi:2-hydroxy-6-oxonona-2,4-dienedioate hydrolase